MRSALIGSVIGVFLLFVSAAAYADPPPGVGAAITYFSDDCCFSAVVLPGEGITSFLPGGFGIVSTCSLDIVHLTTNSANGNINLTCHGRIEYGSTITGFDFLDQGHTTPVQATVAQFDESCDALEQVFGNICKGNNAVAIVEAENTVLPFPPFLQDGAFCNVGTIQDPIVTFDWHQITTRSGKVALSCQYVAE